LWSGVQTRLVAHMIHRRERVDGLIVWDMLCGSLGRPCPKLEAAPRRSTTVAHYSVPPPCIYLFPRCIPDPRDNPASPVWKLDQVSFLSTLHGTFLGEAGDVTEVHISAATSGATVTRTTSLVRDRGTIYQSKPTPLKRATRLHQCGYGCTAGASRTCRNGQSGGAFRTRRCFESVPFLRGDAAGEDSFNLAQHLAELRNRMLPGGCRKTVHQSPGGAIAGRNPRVYRVSTVSRRGSLFKSSPPMTGRG
jgi:hypothetical protein